MPCKPEIIQHNEPLVKSRSGFLSANIGVINSDHKLDRFPTFPWASLERQLRIKRLRTLINPILRTDRSPCRSVAYANNSIRKGIISKHKTSCSVKRCQFSSRIENLTFRVPLNFAVPIMRFLTVSFMTPEANSRKNTHTAQLFTNNRHSGYVPV